MPTKTESQLLDKLARLADALARLSEENEHLRAENAELKRQLRTVPSTPYPTNPGPLAPPYPPDWSPVIPIMPSRYYPPVQPSDWPPGVTFTARPTRESDRSGV